MDLIKEFEAFLKQRAPQEQEPLSPEVKVSTSKDATRLYIYIGKALAEQLKWQPGTLVHPFIGQGAWQGTIHLAPALVGDGLTMQKNNHSGLFITIGRSLVGRALPKATTLPCAFEVKDNAVTLVLPPPFNRDPSVDDLFVKPVVARDIMATLKGMQ